MQVFAVQRIFYEGDKQEVILPPDPRLWLRPQRAATCVMLLGVDTIPESFIALAELSGWRYYEGKFYPTELSE